MFSAYVPPALPVTSDPDQAFTELSSREWAWRAHQFAVNEDTPGNPVYPHLPDVSEKAQNARLTYWKNVQNRLQQIDPARLSAPHRTDYAVYLWQIESLIADQKFRTYQRPLSGDAAFWSDLANIARFHVKAPADYQNFIRQLNDIPRYFAQNIANMQAGLARGFTVPQIALQGREISVRNVLAAKPIEENVFYTPFRHLPAAIPAEAQAHLQAAAQEAIREAVLSAHEKLLRFLEEDYIPNAVQSIAACDLPGGRAFYRAQIRAYTTTDWTPEEIHALGLSEVARLHREMDAVIDESDFKGDKAGFLRFLHHDPRFYATSGADLIGRAKALAREIDGKLDQFFGRRPAQGFEIRPVPEDQAPFYCSASGGAGYFQVNTYDLSARPLYILPALTLHESAPGHAFQMPLAAENPALPAFRRDSFLSAYGEGWALYCERLGDEMGIYKTPYARFGMLNYQAWRAARLVVDTGMHAMGWSRENAQAYLHENTTLAAHEIETEVDRYIAWPGQALAYYIGEMAFWRNRHRAEKALGAKFSLSAFHDAVLDTGSVPLPVLDQRTDRFIRETGRNQGQKEDK